MAPKAAAAPKAKSSVDHASYLDMITDAIVNLKERNGSSRIALKKYVKSNNTINAVDAMFDSLFNRALKSGVDKGVFEQPKGPSGGTKLAKKVPKPAAVKAAPKPKAASEKKAAAAKPKKAPAAKKAAAPKATKDAAKPKAAPKKAAATTAAKPAAKKAAPKKAAAPKAAAAAAEKPAVLSKTKTGRVTKAEPKVGAAKAKKPAAAPKKNAAAPKKAAAKA